jgi:hypothetical protein
MVLPFKLINSAKLVSPILELTNDRQAQLAVGAVAIIQAPMRGIRVV